MNFPLYPKTSRTRGKETMKTLQKIVTTLVLPIPETNEDGQATAEYSLVIVGAAIIAGLLIAWASGGGRITGIFESVVNRVMSILGS